VSGDRSGGLAKRGAAPAATRITVFQRRFRVSLKFREGVQAFKGLELQDFSRGSNWSNIG
jgi:hypothetical protein